MTAVLRFSLACAAGIFSRLRSCYGTMPAPRARRRLARKLLALAGAAQLDQYGFPPPPTGPAALTQWQTMMSDWAGSAPAPPFLAETTSTDTQRSCSQAC